MLRIAKKAALTLALATAFLTPALHPALAEDLPKVQGLVLGFEKDLAITATATLGLDNKRLGDINNGVSKELIFNVDLFRVWNNWPDEFITGSEITRTLKCDPVKGEYLASSFDGSVIEERRFKDCAALVRWALKVKASGFASTKELEPDIYFVKISVKSRIRRLPPVLNHLLFFIRENEFTVSYKSEPFPIGGGKPTAAKDKAGDKDKAKTKGKAKAKGKAGAKGKAVGKGK